LHSRIEGKGITKREIKHNLDINVSLMTIAKRLKEAKLYRSEKKGFFYLPVIKPEDFNLQL
jgi:hypothetical protein